jgi:hypothetical protein
LLSTKERLNDLGINAAAEASQAAQRVLEANGMA